MAMFKKKLDTPWLKHYGDHRKKSLKNKYHKGSIYDKLLETAEKHPEFTALDYFGNKITFDEFIKSINEAARGFVALGARKGDIISICSANIPEAIIAIYAINKIGCIANVFHPLSSPHEIRDYCNIGDSKILVVIDIAWENAKKVLSDTNIKKSIIITPDNYLPTFSKLGYKLLKIKETRKNLQKIFDYPSKKRINWNSFIGHGEYVTDDPYEKMTQKDTAMIIYSGGTTGRSKGIAIPNLAFNCVATQAVNCFPEVCKPGNSILGIMPIFHGFGIGISFHTVLCFGGCNIMFPKFDAKKFDKILATTQPNMIVGVPTLFEAMVRNNKIKKMDLSFIKVAVSGGDKIQSSLVHEVDKLLKKNGSSAHILQGYGLAEALSVVCVNLADSYREDSIGMPIADAYVKIVEPKSHITKPYGEIGEICVAGPNLATCYIGDEKATNETYQKHPDGQLWLHTGDLGYMSEEGFVYLTGRIKRLIISSGYNVYPTEIEDSISTVPEVLLSTVIGVEDKYRGQIPKAFVVLKDGFKPNKEIEQKIKDACARDLAKYKWPRKIEFRESLPKTKIGKVAYTELEKE